MDLVWQQKQQGIIMVPTYTIQLIVFLKGHKVLIQSLCNICMVLITFLSYVAT